MAKQLNNLNSDVTDFLNALAHPFRKEIEQLRMYILSADKQLSENIKWNGPNYFVDSDADRITMRIQPPKKQVQLIFHRGAKKQEQPADILIANKSKLLIWKENDRAIITFKSLQDIEQAKEELSAIVTEWITAVK